jgi:hypothetical protein
VVVSISAFFVIFCTHEKKPTKKKKNEESNTKKGEKKAVLPKKIPCPTTARLQRLKLASWPTTAKKSVCVSFLLNGFFFFFFCFSLPLSFWDFLFL